MSGNNRDVVCIDQSVAVDVAGADVVEIAVATAQPRVVHIRSQVVCIDLLIVVDVARQIAFSSRNLEYIQFAAGTVVANAFRDVQLDVTGLRLFLECECLHVAGAFPAEGVDSCPIFFVHTVGHRAGEDRTVATILARQVVELIQLVDRAQVDNHIERHCVLAVFRMEHIAQLGKVEQTEDFEAFLFFGCYFAANALDRKFQRVGLSLDRDGRPV